MWKISIYNILKKIRIINAVNKISDFVAKQDYESLLAFMEDF